MGINIENQQKEQSSVMVIKKLPTIHQKCQPWGTALNLINVLIETVAIKNSNLITILFQFSIPPKDKFQDQWTLIQ